MIHGRNLIILADGVAIAAAKSCEISVNTEAYEVSSPATAGWRYRKVGRSEWSVSVSTLVTTVRDRFLNVGQQVTLIFSAGDNDKMTGTAYIKKSEVSAARGSLAKGSYQFQGVSDLTEYTEE